jgi:hypothetical protein
MTEQKHSAFSFGHRDPTSSYCGQFQCTDTKVHYHCVKCKAVFDTKENLEAHEKDWTKHAWQCF